MKLIPVPKKITEREGALSLSGVSIKSAASDVRLSCAAVTLKGDIENVTGKPVKVKCGESACKCSTQIFITDADKRLSGDAYKLDITQSGVTIAAGAASGAFYGIQTLRQLIHEYGKKLPFCTIEDSPDYADRGFYHDITRGRVPTLEKLKQIASTLSYYKMNSLQLYVEDAFDFVEFDGIVTKDNVLTAEEMLELDDFCYNNFIELVPSLSCFGHLYNLLQSKKYAHLCELPDYKPTQLYWIEKMAHHTIDVSNEESIKLILSMIDQYIPLFRSDKFNICCDETFDLCRGRNAGLDSGEEYFKFVSKIIAHLKKRGKTVMMWGDIVLCHPEKMNLLPKDTIMLNWCYEKEPSLDNVKAFAKADAVQYVCPGTSTWNRFVEEIGRSEGNISKMAEYGFDNGAVGFLNTNWGDFGNLCSFNASLYSTVIGAEKSWNVKHPITDEFEKAASALLYDSAKTNVIDLIKKMGDCERSAEWTQFIYWYSANTVENRRTELGVDKKKCLSNIKKCEAIIEKLSKTGSDERYTDLVLAAGGIILINKIFLKFGGYITDTAQLQDEAKEWLKRYRRAWLRDDKPSQIDLIEKFIKKVTK